MEQQALAGDLLPIVRSLTSLSLLLPQDFCVCFVFSFILFALVLIFDTGSHALALVGLELII